MTINELIENFEAQQIKTRVEIQKLKETLKDREEYLVKLIGGIEALKLYQEQQISETDDTGA
jgi:hypothetical protein